uniref:RNA helicase n=1 Tax=Neobenedenia girellae TaxID=280698 RepID=A1IIT5_9PLAT|nr:RNA helicase [Neobenedenia girellae]
MARDCEKPQTCRKCGETGHIGRDCPTVGDDRACNFCQETGHLAKECPKKPCRNCGELGHHRDECPAPPKCGNCRAEGHFIEDCPEPLTCRNCGQEGHMSSACTEPAKCRECNEEGHQAKDCPNAKCRNCGELGHRSRECNNAPVSMTVTDPDTGEERQTIAYVPAARTEDVAWQHNHPVGDDFAVVTDVDVKRTGNNAENVPVIEHFMDATDLPDTVKTNIDRANYAVPTPVQRFLLPVLLAGRDALATAQTGSGKTAAFMLPILKTVLDPSKGPVLGVAADGKPAPRAIVVVPTHELAQQILFEGMKFATGTSVRVHLTHGGVNVRHDLMQLRSGVSVLVATPGRLLHFIRSGLISLSMCNFIVLDEADRLLDEGFEGEMREFLEHEDLPPRETRQVVMLSATFEDEVRDLGMSLLADPITVTVGVVGVPPGSINQEIIAVPNGDKHDKLLELLKTDIDNYKQNNVLKKIIVFVERRRTAQQVASALSMEEVPAVELQGELSQMERDESMHRFRYGDAFVLVATAIAARGLDIVGVDHVINYDLPSHIYEYVHRIGRTGRVGHLGRATSFFDSDSSNDSRIAPKLVEAFEATGVEVPDFLKEASANGGGGGEFGDTGGDFGGGGGGGGDDFDW